MCSYPNRDFWHIAIFDTPWLADTALLPDQAIFDIYNIKQRAGESISKWRDRYDAAIARGNELNPAQMPPAPDLAKKFLQHSYGYTELWQTLRTRFNVTLGAEDYPQTIEAMHKLYIEHDVTFRGFRQTWGRLSINWCPSIN